MPSTLRLPRRLAEGAAIAHHRELRAWTETLPDVVAFLAERWCLKVGEPFEPGGAGSWVAPARDADGRDLVLKAGWRHTEATHEADGLRLWNGDGTVILHDAVTFDETSALLLERCVPGTTLSSS